MITIRPPAPWRFSFLPKGEIRDQKEEPTAERVERSMRETIAAGTSKKGGDMPRAAASAAMKNKSLYGVHPGVYMVQDWIAKLAPARAGNPITQFPGLH